MQVSFARHSPTFKKSSASLACFAKIHHSHRMTFYVMHMMTNKQQEHDDLRQLAATVDFWFSSLVNHGDLPASVLDSLVQNVSAGHFLTLAHSSTSTVEERLKNELGALLLNSGVLSHRLCVDLPLTSDHTSTNGLSNVWDGRIPASLFISFHKSRDCVVQVWESDVQPLDSRLVAQHIVAAAYQVTHVMGSHRC
jgi:hypothetical protein